MPDTVVMLEELKKDIKNDYDEICRLAPEFSRHPLREFTKTRTIVNSSYFSFTANQQKLCGLVPYAGKLQSELRLLPSQFGLQCSLGLRR